MRPAHLLTNLCTSSLAYHLRQPGVKIGHAKFYQTSTIQSNELGKFFNQSMQKGHLNSFLHTKLASKYDQKIRLLLYDQKRSAIFITDKSKKAASKTNYLKKKKKLLEEKNGICIFDYFNLIFI